MTCEYFTDRVDHEDGKISYVVSGGHFILTIAEPDKYLCDTRAPIPTYEVAELVEAMMNSIDPKGTT